MAAPYLEMETSLNLALRRELPCEGFYRVAKSYLL